MEKQLNMFFKQMMVLEKGGETEKQGATILRSKNLTLWSESTSVAIQDFLLLHIKLFVCSGDSIWANHR